MEETACNACGAAAWAALFRASDCLSGEEFQVVRCSHCGLCYVNPRPTADQIARYYSEAYFGERHPFFAEFMMSLRVRKLPRLPGTPRLLDVGCGRGDFILRCRKHGWVVSGVEQAHSPIMELKEALGIEVYEPEAMGTIPSEQFDVVTFWHVFEHVADPGATLEQTWRILKPGGVVLIEVPNFGGWQGQLGGPVWFHLDVPRHLFHFEKQPLERLLHRRGFRALRWQSFSLEYDAFGLAQTLLNRICSHPNHLFQKLIQRGGGQSGGALDTALSLGLLPLLLAVALPVSVLAAAFGRGGMLRVWAEKV